MKRHLAYLKYVLRHKWFVFKASNKLGGSVARAIFHDFSKFLPSEWMAYSFTFYNSDGTSRYIESEWFTRAWQAHQRRNSHHWQYWLITWDRGDTEPIQMDFYATLEMLADWFGAGRAITGKWEVWDWYEKNKDIIKLHPATRGMVEHILLREKGHW